MSAPVLGPRPARPPGFDVWDPVADAWRMSRAAAAQAARAAAEAERTENALRAAARRQALVTARDAWPEIPAGTLPAAALTVQLRLLRAVVLALVACVLALTEDD